MDLHQFVNIIQNYNYKSDTLELDKKIYDIYEMNYGEYSITAISNLLLDSNEYETYISLIVSDDKVINFLYKRGNDKNINDEYFKSLKELVINNNFDEIINKIKASGNH